MTAKPNVVCFGEILWDVLPSATKPGGAPMNVAYHLNRLGINASLISRVGIDEPGRKLLEVLHNWQLSGKLVQMDAGFATSEVHAVPCENHEMSYDILYPVAWDHISYEREYESLAKNSDAFVFGSLVTRNNVSRKTLFQLLDAASYRVFDTNLRAPHYAPEIIEELLYKTDLLKLNASELHMVSSWFRSSVKSDEDCVKLLQDDFNIKEIIVTRGSKGASYFTPSTRFDYAAYKVDVADTVGSGDAFLAGFLAKKLQKNCIDTSVSFAAALGAFVTMHYGACPQYTLNEIETFKRDKELAGLYNRTVPHSIQPVI